MVDAFAEGELLQPARGFIEGFEGEFEAAVVHGDESFRVDVFEDFDRFVGAHVDVAERVGIIGADGEHGDFGGEAAADFLEAIGVGAVADVVDMAGLVFDVIAALTAMVVANHARAPMFARSERHLPVFVGEGFPPLQLDDAFEAEAVREFAHAPGDDGDA